MQRLTPEELILQTNYITHQLDALSQNERMSPLTHRPYNIHTEIVGGMLFITCDLHVNDNLVSLTILLERYPTLAPKIYINDVNGSKLVNTIDNIRYYLTDVELPYGIDIDRYYSGEYLVDNEYRNGWLFWNPLIGILEIIHIMEYLLNYTELDTTNKDTKLYANIGMIPPEIREILLDDYICEICLDSLLRPDSENPLNNEDGFIYQLHCGQEGAPHVFHLSCLYEWTLQNPICPKCRTPTRFYNEILKGYTFFNNHNTNGLNFFRGHNIAPDGGSKKIKKNIKIKKSIKRNIRKNRKSKKYA
jgi:hypothetical protein